MLKLNVAFGGRMEAGQWRRSRRRPYGRPDAAGAVEPPALGGATGALATVTGLGAAQEGNDGMVVVGQAEDQRQVGIERDDDDVALSPRYSTRLRISS